MLEATRLWTKTSAKGETYLVGRMGSLRVMVFENKYAEEGGNDPSHRLMVDEHQEQEKKE